MEPTRKSEMQEYAWKYFSLHADQRLKTFNFFLILATVIVGGLLTYVKDAKIPWFASGGGLILAVLSLIFFKLDHRNRELIHHAEEALRRLEQDISEAEVPNELRLFTAESTKTAERRLEQGTFRWWNLRSWFWGHALYSECFGVVFFCFALLGLLIAAGAWFLPTPQQATPPPVTQQQFFIGGQPLAPANPSKSP